MDKNNIKELTNLIGEISDYKSEISENDEEEENQQNPGAFTEKYFNEKLQMQLDSKHSFSNTKILIPEILGEMILKINKSVIKNDLNTSKAFKLIKELNNHLEGETQIEIDSMFPMIPGKKINDFFKKINEFSFPNFILDEQNKYTIIVESTFNLKSQIIKKVEQIRKSFLVFSLLDKLYNLYPEYLEDYYQDFIRKYIINEKLDKKENTIIKNKINLLDFGFYVFLIITNKKYKSFEELEYISLNFPYDKNKIDNSLKKCFNFPITPITINKSYKIPQIKSKIYKNDKEFKDCLEKVKKNHDLSKAYETLNFLIENINLEKKFYFKVIYFDTYLNLMSPKSFIVNKLEQYSKELNNFNNNLKKTNDKYKKIEKENTKLKNNVDILSRFIKSKFPDFDLTKLK